MHQSAPPRAAKFRLHQSLLCHERYLTLKPRPGCKQAG
jgi:hypothetical protein